MSEEVCIRERKDEGERLQKKERGQTRKRGGKRVREKERGSGQERNKEWVQEKDKRERAREKVSKKEGGLGSR